MEKQKIYPLAVALMTVLITLACGFSVSTANFKDAYMARDYAGNERTTTFAQGDDFYCIVLLRNAPDDTKVKASWIAVEVEGEQPNTFIDDTTGDDTLHFSLTNSNLWPIGRYKVELYLNDKLERSLEFEVK